MTPLFKIRRDIESEKILKTMRERKDQARIRAPTISAYARNLQPAKGECVIFSAASLMRADDSTGAKVRRPILALQMPARFGAAARGR